VSLDTSHPDFWCDVLTLESLLAESDRLPPDRPFGSSDQQRLLQQVQATREEVTDAASYTELKDAPIVAAARKAHVDYLLTFDRKHLLNPPEVAAQSGLTIVLPEELLKILRHA